MLPQHRGESSNSGSTTEGEKNVGCKCAGPLKLSIQQMLPKNFQKFTRLSCCNRRKSELFFTPFFHSSFFSSLLDRTSFYGAPGGGGGGGGRQWYFVCPSFLAVSFAGLRGSTGGIKFRQTRGCLYLFVYLLDQFLRSRVFIYGFFYVYSIILFDLQLIPEFFRFSFSGSCYNLKIPFSVEKLKIRTFFRSCH